MTYQLGKKDPGASAAAKPTDGATLKIENAPPAVSSEDFQREELRMQIENEARNTRRLIFGTIALALVMAGLFLHKKYKNEMGEVPVLTDAISRVKEVLPIAPAVIKKEIQQASAFVASSPGSSAEAPKTGLPSTESLQTQAENGTFVYDAKYKYFIRYSGVFRELDVDELQSASTMKGLAKLGVLTATLNENKDNFKPTTVETVSPGSRDSASASSSSTGSVNATNAELIESYKKQIPKEIDLPDAAAKLQQMQQMMQQHNDQLKELDK